MSCTTNGLPTVSKNVPKWYYVVTWRWKPRQRLAWGTHDCWRIWEVQAWVLKYDRRFRGQVGMPLGTNRNLKEPNYTKFFCISRRAQCFLSCRTNLQTIHCKRNRRDGEGRYHLTRHSAVNEPNRLCTKKNRLNQFLCRLPRTERRNQRDSYLLPRIEECINLLGEPRIFSNLDAKFG